MEVGGGLFVLVVGELLLVLVKIANDFRTIAWSISEIWMGWLVSCVGELLVVVAAGLMKLMEWVAVFPNKFGSESWAGWFSSMLAVLENRLGLLVAVLVVLLMGVALVVNGEI